MYPSSFEYYRASSVADAIRLLGEHEDAKVLAGGHSLIPMMKLRLASPPAVIDIGRLAELRGITKDGGACRIGALATHAEIASSEVLSGCCPLLPQAAAAVGDPAVRNKGTIGGNIAHADPASDLPAALCALGATIHIEGPNGARSVAARDFFQDLLTTDLGEHEILTAVELTGCCGPDNGCVYLKVEHPASGYAVCGTAAVVGWALDGTCGTASLCFNGVTATPHCADAVCEALLRSDLSDATIDAAVDAHLQIAEPLSDVHASGEYRSHLARVYGKRALKAARDQAKR